MIELKYSEVPVWLQDSAFFHNLDGEELNGGFVVPSDCFRETCEPIQTMEDVMNTLRVVRYWGLASIPISILEFCYSNKSCWECLDTAGENWSELEALIFAFKDSRPFTLCKALTTNRPEFVSFWLSKNLQSNDQNKHAIAQACRFGRLDLVKILREREFPWDHLAYCAAAQYGHLYTLQCLFKNGCVGNRTAMQFAARGGQLDCMKFLHSIGCPWFEDVTLEFAVAPHFVFVRALKRFWTDDFSILPPANGSIDCLRYALENGCPIHEYSCREAAKYGLLDCLQLLHLYQAPWNENITTAAASAGHLDCLMYLVEQKCPVSSRDTVGAAAYGHLDCLVYLHTHGCVLSKDCCESAAEGGRLTCLQYLHEIGCEWDNRATASAARSNRLDCLQYLHTNDCEWDASTPVNAAGNGHIDCLRYALEHGCPHNIQSLVQAAAGEKGSMSCLKYLIEERGVDVQLDAEVFGAAFVKGNLASVQYLLEMGCECKSYVYVRHPMEFTFSFTDADFLRCIELAVEQGWQTNKSLYSYVVEPSARLPLCLAYLNARLQSS